MANPTTVTWTDPTANTDGSSLSSGEITGYQIGVRPVTGVAGIYPFTNTVAATASSGALPALAPGSYVAAVMAVGAIDSAWSSESNVFTIAAPIPNPPSAVSVA